MRSFPLGPLYESQTRVRQEFLDFAEQWQKTREGWRDEPARKFEQESLCTLGPALKRAAAAMQNFADAVRQSDHLLADPEHSDLD